MQTNYNKGDEFEKVIVKMPSNGGMSKFFEGVENKDLTREQIPQNRRRLQSESSCTMTSLRIVPEINPPLYGLCYLICVSRCFELVSAKHGVITF